MEDVHLTAYKGAYLLMASQYGELARSAYLARSEQCCAQRMYSMDKLTFEATVFVFCIPWQGMICLSLAVHTVTAHSRVSACQ